MRCCGCQDYSWSSTHLSLWLLKKLCYTKKQMAQKGNSYHPTAFASLKKCRINLRMSKETCEH